MTKFVNRAKVYTATTGTGNVTLGLAVLGYQTFVDAGVADADIVRYTIEDGTDWEIGTGTYSAAGNILTRSVTESSNAGSLINLTGAATIYVTAAADDLLQPQDIGITVQGYSAALQGTTASYTTALDSKLNGIEVGATADQTASEIKTAYESNANTNAYSDAEKSKLAAVEAGATADQTAAEILTAIKTVDGTGTGLDADLLDGQHGTYYTGYTDTAIANLVATAPATLDTLNELATALGNDPNFATTVTTSIGTKAPINNATFTGTTVVPTADINGGTIDGTTIGSASPAAITGTSITGTSFVSSGNMNFGDNDKAVFGAGADLQIFHDAGNSYISEVGTGDLIVRAGNLRMQNSTGTAQYILADDGGAVQLRYNGTTKIATTATGIDVTGTVTADGLTVDTNTLFVDAANNRVGLGTINPSEKLTVIGNGTFGDSTTKYNAITINGGHVNDGGNDYGLTISSFEPAITLIDRSSGSGSTQLFGTNNGGLWLVGDTLNDGTIGHTANTTDFFVAKFEPLNTIFYTSGVESMRINSAGSVGIGTSSPTSELQVVGTVTATAFSGPLTGAVTGNATTATTLQTARTIALAGDVTGSVSFNGSANVTITAAVVDDSHNHIIANVDGLQAALDSKGPTNGIFYENDQTISTSYTIAANKNAMTTGPITINSGVVVTVSTGARWVVI